MSDAGTGYGPAIEFYLQALVALFPAQALEVAGLVADLGGVEESRLQGHLIDLHARYTTGELLWRSGSADGSP